MEILLKTDRKPDVHMRKLGADPETLHELRLALQGLLVDRPIGPLTKDQFDDLELLRALEAHNAAVEMVNLQDDYEEVGVTPFIDSSDGKPYVATGELPNAYYFETHSRIACGMQVWKNSVVLCGVLLVMNGLGSSILWGLVDLIYPLGFMQQIISHKVSQFHGFLIKYSVGSTMSLLSVWIGGWVLLCILCWRPNFMKSGFTLITLSMIPVTLYAFLITYSQRFVSQDHTELFDVLTRARATYNESVLWESTEENGYIWDNLQFSLKCCGIYEWTDWLNKSVWGEREWILAMEQGREPRQYPESCCVEYVMEVNRHKLIRKLDYGMEMLYCQTHPAPAVNHMRGCLQPCLDFFTDFTSAVICFAMFHNLLVVMSCIAVGKLYIERRRLTDPEYIYGVRAWIFDFFIVGWFRDFFQDPVKLKRFEYGKNPYNKDNSFRFRPIYYDQRGMTIKPDDEAHDPNNDQQVAVTMPVAIYGGSIPSEDDAQNDIEGTVFGQASRDRRKSVRKTRSAN